MSENSKVKNLRAEETQGPEACPHCLASCSRLCLARTSFLISIFVWLFSVYFFLIKYPHLVDN